MSADFKVGDTVVFIGRGNSSYAKDFFKRVGLSNGSTYIVCSISKNGGLGLCGFKDKNLFINRKFFMEVGGTMFETNKRIEVAEEIARKIEVLLKEHNKVVLKDAMAKYWSGGIDVATYEDQGYALAKVLLTSALHSKADVYAPVCEPYKADVKNLENF